MNQIAIIVLCTGLVIITTDSFSQKSKSVYVRVFDAKGTRIAGKLVSVQDSALIIQAGNWEGDRLVSMRYQQIKYIKSGRSEGAGMATGFAIGALTGLVAGIGATEYFGEGFVAEAMVGLGFWGSIFGLFVGGAVQKPTLEVNQDFEKFTIAAEKLRERQNKKKSY